MHMGRMRLGRLCAALSVAVLAAAGPVRAELCEAKGPVQVGLMSRLPLPDHAIASLTIPQLMARAEAAERKPQSLKELEARARMLDQRFRALGPLEVQALMRRVEPQLARLEPKTEAAVDFIHALQFIGRKGWALEWHGRLFETSDGGLNWSRRTVPVPQAKAAARDTRPSPERPATDDDALRALQFLTLQTGYAVGHRGVIATTDGGAHWVQLGNPSRNQLLALACVPDGTCWVAGNEAGLVYRRRAGSPVWDAQATPATEGMISLHFVDASTGWAAGNAGEIIATTDGGATWALQHSDRNTRFWSIYFLDKQRGWAAGENGALLRTVDGGATWTEGELAIPASLPRYELRFHAVRFLDADRGWAAGLHGIIFGTTDGGRCWRVERYEGASHALTIYALATGEGPTVWAAGNSGLIMVTRDLGGYWFPVNGLALQMMDIIEKALNAMDN